MLQRLGDLVIAGGVFVLAQSAVDHGPESVGGRVGRLQGDDLRKVGDGGVVVALHEEGPAPEAIGLGPIGPSPNGPRVVGDGPIVLVGRALRGVGLEGVILGQLVHDRSSCMSRGGPCQTRPSPDRPLYGPRPRG